MIFGQLAHAQATRRQVYQYGVYAGEALSLQGWDKRFTAQAADFLEALLGEALSSEARGSSEGSGLLKAFEGVYVVDSTRLKHGEKLLTRLNLKTAQLQIERVSAQRHDNGIDLAHAPLPCGALRLADLGFFDLKQFQQDHQRGVFWISRYKARTQLFDVHSGQALDVLACLATEGEICRRVWVGHDKTVQALLVARPICAQDTQARQARRQQRARRKQQTLSPQTLALAAWDIYLTNLFGLAPQAILALARIRWQIELVFKLWKSYFGLERLQSADPIRQRCLFFAKLLAIWLAHILFGLDDQPLNRSWWQAALTVRDHTLCALHALVSPTTWLAFLQRLAYLLPSTSRMSKRSAHPLTFQILQHDP